VLAALALAVCVMAALAAPSLAAPRLGIADQRATVFADKRLHALKVGYARLVVPYDVARDPRLARSAGAWLRSARAHRIRVLVGFAGSSRHRKAPSVAAYRSAVRAFRARYPWVREFEAFNEPNHSTQPTYRRPELAAGYWRALRADCRRCDVAAGGLTGFSVRTRRWFARYRRALHARPRTWAFHNYDDVNRGSTRQVRAFLAATGSGKVWLTETAGVLRMRGRRVLAGVTAQRAREATAWRALSALRRVKRIYRYQWRAVRHERWDSALLDERGRPRPVYSVYARR
jgi:polysaccharide biosynthesis protein PslG